MTGRTKVEIIRRGIETLVAPGARISYAQTGEDIILDFLCDFPPTGFYVDVGANDAINHSNSYRFYRKGWKGISVDANPSFAARHKRYRPRDRFVHACVSDVVETVDFHIFNSDGLSSISGHHLYDNDDHYRLERLERVQTRTLSEILIDCDAPRQFEFLSIDAEGHDEAVLRSLDLERFQPRVILTEANGTDFEVGKAGTSWPARHLAGFGYELMAVNWSNLYFRKSGHREML